MNLSSVAKQHIRGGQEFSLIRLLYTYADNKIAADGTTSFVKIYSIYEAYPFEDSDPILLYDKNNIIAGGKRKYTIQAMDNKILDAYYDKSTPQEKIALENIVKTWGFRPKSYIDTKRLLHDRLFIPSYRLSTPSFMFGDDGRKIWKDLLDNLLSFGNVKKDSRLREVCKAHLLRGYDQHYNAHAIVCTNPQTGKTSYYDRVGSRYDKLTSNSLIGFAKGNNEIHYGAINGQCYTLTIEQIESQIAQSLLGFLLTFMEKGDSNLSTGGVEMKIKGDCPIVLTANPTGYDTDKIASFKSLIDHLTTNHLALGRRFGIIVYGNDYKTVDENAYLDEEEWGLYFELFRSVEEYAWPRIKKIYQNKEVLQWLNSSIPDYHEKVMSITEKVYDSSVRDFIKTHSQSGFKHLRGGAFSCALLDNIPDIIQADEEDIEMLIKPIINGANEHLSILMQINLESFANMAALLENDGQIKDQLTTSLPHYLTEIIEAVKAYKAKDGNIAIGNMKINELDDYAPHKHYEHLSLITNSILKNGKRWRSYNNMLTKYFGFMIVEKDGNFLVEFS